jgi:hypothetical protein
MTNPTPKPELPAKPAEQPAPAAAAPTPTYYPNPVVIPAQAVTTLLDADPFVAAAKAMLTYKWWLPRDPAKLANDPGFRSAVIAGRYALELQLNEMQRLNADLISRLARIQRHAQNMAASGQVFIEIIGYIPPGYPQ